MARKLIQRARRGFTLVELMIVVAIIGVLAALAIYGVRKYIANAKTAEARMSIGRIAKDASAAYNKENMGATVLPIGNSAGLSNVLCTSSTPVPTAAAQIQGQKYQSKPVDWGGSQLVGWACLHFSMQDPQYYMYQYVSPNTTSFAATANGDLNGDGVLSTFTLSGAIQNIGASGGAVVTIAPSIQEINPED